MENHRAEPLAEKPRLVAVVHLVLAFAKAAPGDPSQVLPLGVEAEAAAGADQRDVTPEASTLLKRYVRLDLCDIIQDLLPEKERFKNRNALVSSMAKHQHALGISDVDNAAFAEIYTSLKKGTKARVYFRDSSSPVGPQLCLTTTRQFAGVRYRDPTAGDEVVAGEKHLDLALSALKQRPVDPEALSARFKKSLADLRAAFVPVVASTVSGHPLQSSQVAPLLPVARGAACPPPLCFSPPPVLPLWFVRFFLEA